MLGRSKADLKDQTRNHSEGPDLKCRSNTNERGQQSLNLRGFMGEWGIKPCEHPGRTKAAGR